MAITITENHFRLATDRNSVEIVVASAPSGEVATRHFVIVDAVTDEDYAEANAMIAREVEKGR